MCKWQAYVSWVMKSSPLPATSSSHISAPYIPPRDKAWQIRSEAMQQPRTRNIQTRSEHRRSNVKEEGFSWTWQVLFLMHELQLQLLRLQLRATNSARSSCMTTHVWHRMGCWRLVSCWRGPSFYRWGIDFLLVLDEHGHQLSGSYSRLSAYILISWS